MSLLRLLTTGRSLVGLREGSTPYRMRRQSLLPKFGGKGNPFRPAGSPQSAEQESSILPAAQETAEPVTAPEPGTDTACSAPNSPFRKGGPVSSKPEWFRRWVRALCAVAGKRGNQFEAKPSSSGPGLVQAELSLEKVRPLRNDLSDSDNQIPSTAPTPTRAPEALPGTENLTVLEAAERR